MAERDTFSSSDMLTVIREVTPLKFDDENKAKYYWRLLQEVIVPKQLQNRLSFGEKNMPNIVLKKLRTEKANQLKQIRLEWDKKLREANRKIKQAHIMAEKTHVSVQENNVLMQKRMIELRQKAAVSQAAKEKSKSQGRQEAPEGYQRQLAEGNLRIRKIQAQFDRLKVRKKMLKRMSVGPNTNAKGNPGNAQQLESNRKTSTSAVDMESHSGSTPNIEEDRGKSETNVTLSGPDPIRRRRMSVALDQAVPNQSLFHRLKTFGMQSEIDHLHEAEAEREQAEMKLREEMRKARENARAQIQTLKEKEKELMKLENMRLKYRQMVLSERQRVADQAFRQQRREEALRKRAENLKLWEEYRKLQHSEKISSLNRFSYFQPMRTKAFKYL